MSSPLLRSLKLNFQQQLRRQHLKEDKNGPKVGEIHLPLRFARQMWPIEAEKLRDGRAHVTLSRFSFGRALFLRSRS